VFVCVRVCVYVYVHIFMIFIISMYIRIISMYIRKSLVCNVRSWWDQVYACVCVSVCACI